MNDELQVQRYQHNYIAIGDDGGGLVFLMKQEANAEEVICVNMSDYDVNDPFCKIKNFNVWYKEGCNMPEEMPEDELTLSKELPGKLIKNITYAKAVKLMEKVGETEIFLFNKSGK